MKHSDTRGASLINLAGLCFILGDSVEALSVRQLANKAIECGIFNFGRQQRGAHLDTRINHHVRALRALQLIESEEVGGHKYYRLTASGSRVHGFVKDTYGGTKIKADTNFRALWRPIIIESSYVRAEWLKYFMPLEDFTCEQLISDGGWITIYRVPMEHRAPDKDSKGHLIDSGLRLESRHWETREFTEGDRREIYEGLRRWTNEVYLTDDRVPVSEAAPFLHFSQFDSDETLEVESHIVKGWFDPAKDLLRFEQLVQETLNERRRGDRITIPDLIIELCRDHGYAKDNVKEMLTELFYERGNHYYFERGSQALIDNAFRLKTKENPAVYYLKLEGVWRTSIVRYGTMMREASR